MCFQSIFSIGESYSQPQARRLRLVQTGVRRQEKLIGQGFLLSYGGGILTRRRKGISPLLGVLAAGIVVIIGAASAMVYLSPNGSVPAANTSTAYVTKTITNTQLVQSTQTVTNTNLVTSATTQYDRVNSTFYSTSVVLSTTTIPVGVYTTTSTFVKSTTSTSIEFLGTATSTTTTTTVSKSTTVDSTSTATVTVTQNVTITITT